ESDQRCRRKLRSFSTLNAQCSTLNIQLKASFIIGRWTLNVERWTLLFAAHESGFTRPADHDRRSRQGIGWENREVIPESETGRLYFVWPQHRKRAAVEKTDR